ARYAVAVAEGEALILAAPLLEKALGETEHQLATTLEGNALVGLRYQPPYQPAEWGVQPMFFDRSQGGRLLPVEGEMPETAHTVIAADFVSMEDGTGIVHIAPAFGGEDFDLGRELGLLFLQPVDLNGSMTGGPFDGKFVKDADPQIIEDLQQRGLLLRHETIKHTYPFCWRCKTPLLFYAKPTWYIRTTAVKDGLLQGNARINWYPEHIKEGRFGNWLANNIDWAVGRERYWGTPFPVWHCQACGANRCVGSRQELVEAALDKAAAEFLDDLHRPYIDRIRLRCEQCSGEMQRQIEVLDAWFDSGAMPYAQWHFPFENERTFRQSFPADFICEAVDQTRGWFYTLLAEAALLHHAVPDQVPEGIAYRNVISLGHIQDDKGRKMSKSLGNVVEPSSVIDVHGADALRWYLYTATPAGNPRRFSAELVAESLRRFLLTLWNTYSFFVTYANIDGFNPSTSPQGERNELDQWVLSELNALVEKVTSNLEVYNATDAGRAIQDFVEELSNWYVRRSRRRFWKPVLSGVEGSENDSDKLAAYHTLYECLVTVTKLMAPFTPFITEAMYQNLVRAADPQAPESVHLAQWPEADPSLIDRKLMEETQLVMRVVSLGRAARSKAGIKVRQPLAKMIIRPKTLEEIDAVERRQLEVLDELNVKKLNVEMVGAGGRGADVDPDSYVSTYPAVNTDEAGYAVGLDTKLTPELEDEGLARELVHRIQNLRKAAGFEIADRIVTYFSGSDRLSQVLSEHGDYVRQETLSEELRSIDPPADAFTEEQKLDGQTMRLAVQRLG
ncbi:MAG TPA: class I tRNA ligase family protein, partial [Dehalococcoidia bacterium]|nr:class I tRNA ligase family protein [Dehalococcoidia bacterium]